MDVLCAYFRIDFLQLSVSHLPDDYRLFCGDLGNEVNDDVLSKAFARFPTFNMAKVSVYLSLSSFSCLFDDSIWFRMNIF